MRGSKTPLYSPLDIKGEVNAMAPLEIKGEGIALAPRTQRLQLCIGLAIQFVRLTDETPRTASRRVNNLANCSNPVV